MFSMQVIFVTLFVILNISGLQAYSWRSSKLGLPSNAVIAGYEPNNMPIYVARAEHKGFFVLGKVLKRTNRAYISYGGKEWVKDDWEYLIGETFSWVRSYDGLVPRNAVKNEHAENNQHEYVGRQFHQEILTPGKIVPKLKLLYVAFSSKEHGYDKYEVLVSPKCDCALSILSRTSISGFKNSTVFQNS